MTDDQQESERPLEQPERLMYRDRLRSARYAALADSEGFQEVCYAVEALGMRLHGAEGTMDKYRNRTRKLALEAPTLSALATKFPMFFTRFEALYETVRRARNDAMHTGAYARHATSAAIELCIGLEEAVMNGPVQLTKVADFMVKAPVSVETWQPVAHARQLMLMHSFSFLPVFHKNTWHLLSDMAMVTFIRPKKRQERDRALALPIIEAVSAGLALMPAETLRPEDEISVLIQSPESRVAPTLWIVVAESNRLTGVLSPFELM